MNNGIDIATLSTGEIKQEGVQRTLIYGQDLVLIGKLKGQDLHHSPLEVGFLVIGMCLQGEATFTINGEERNIKTGNLIILFGGQVIGEGKHSPDFCATMVLMSRSFAQDCVMGLNYMWPYLLYIIHHPILELSTHEQAWIWECYHLLCRRLGKSSGRYLRETVIALTRAFYFEICDMLEVHVQPHRTTSHNRSYAIFDQFMRLASQSFKQQRSVEWYASEMCLTPKHLSEVVKGVSGRTAGQWITTLVMIEIKTLLQNSSLSIKEIAQEMNFPNQSFLGKYFKNIEGVSPTDFRKRSVK